MVIEDMNWTSIIKQTTMLRDKLISQTTGLRYWHIVCLLFNKLNLVTRLDIRGLWSHWKGNQTFVIKIFNKGKQKAGYSIP